MQLSSGTQIPDGLLADIALRNEKPRLGVPSRNPALHQGIDASNSTIVLELQSSAALNRIGSRSTGKERDPESGLDYFGARYFASNNGRWMSPDWAAKAEPIPYAKMGNPQSLNLYAYVENNPLSMADADGHCGAASPIPCGGQADAIADSDAGQDQLRAKNAAANAEEAKRKAQEEAKPAQYQDADTNQMGSNVVAQGKGERGQTSKPDKPTKGARPIRDKDGKITGWSIPSPDGKRTNKPIVGFDGWS